MMTQCMSNYKQRRKVVWAQGYGNLQFELNKREELLMVVEIQIIQNVSKKEIYQYLIDITYFVGDVVDDDLISTYFDVTIEN